MSASEVKRLMVQLKDVKEERNKYRDALMKNADITPARLLTELMCAYSEGLADSEFGLEEDTGFERSWTFGTFLTEWGTDEMTVMSKRQIIEALGDKV